MVWPISTRTAFSVAAAVTAAAVAAVAGECFESKDRFLGKEV